ncbi:hypothetical protein [Nocardia seriolae]|uniref:Prephenate dehydrogenase n=1 Tax=Nocardia seriolae TaxID=37332 RepID=A0A0B8MZ57_9NOCA|nr:hypothetical protein [Nocardia seriolae]APB01695.1 hypothetical protein NS506_07676 [Nocardia seriolae]MTJ60837.1 hypothetical protein [Nocardia seriolae]MTJ76130.1 hypothetical protein [Nocardia seriolae]MTJ91021.1 hypothetical protein [Nocardia seriolae]MTK34983.1 hypothetical protein [Nocardia seriolae]
MIEYLDEKCCGQPMVKIPARPADAPFEYLMHCYECGHYEPWDVDEDPTTGDGQPAGGPAVRGSGYQWCGCRDCFDTVVGTVGTLTLCDGCAEAGCEIQDGECQREDAYGN